MITILEESLGLLDQLCFFLFGVSLQKEHHVPLYCKSCLVMPALVKQVPAYVDSRFVFKIRDFFFLMFSDWS